MLKRIIRKNRPSLLLTAFLLLSEAFLTLLFPLAIGVAIDSAIVGEIYGAVQLGLLGLLALLFGGLRRLFDSRLYARVYQELAPKMVAEIGPREHSTKSARLGMLRELVEILENALPELISSVIALVGVLIILATLNQDVFHASLGATCIIGLIYWKGRKKTLHFNQSYNDELEEQVKVLSQNEAPFLNAHLKKLMTWNIRLSDLEVKNFSLSWMVLMCFLVGSVLLSVNDGATNSGTIFSLLMYVFQFVESIVGLPLYYQNWLRLKEIMTRIES